MDNFDNLQGRIEEIDNQIVNLRQEQEEVRRQIDSYREEGTKEGIIDNILDRGSDTIESEEDLQVMHQRIEEIDRQIASLEQEKTELVNTRQGDL